MRLTQRRGGELCVWAGMLGAASAGWLIAVDPAVPDTQFSYPLGAGAFALIQVWFAVQHLGLLAGIWALERFDISGQSLLAKVGHWIAGLGMLGLAAMELVAITAADAAYPSSQTDPIDAGYGLTSTAIGVGLILVGVATARAGVWTGPKRWIPLGLGVYQFVPMFPAIFGPFVVARLAIGGWMLGFALLGGVLVAESAGARVSRRGPVEPALR